MTKNKFEQNPITINEKETMEQIFELHDLSPKEVLKHFAGGGAENEERIELLLQKINSVAHIGIEVTNIEDAIAKLQLSYPERGYKLIKKFQSVGIPRNYEGSTCVIAQIKPDNLSYPALELFSIDWQGKYQKIPEKQRGKLIEHIALSTTEPQDVGVVIEDLSKVSKKIKSVIPPQVNQEAGEIFGYLINNEGEKIEIVHHIQSKSEPS